MLSSLQGISRGACALRFARLLASLIVLLGMVPGSAIVQAAPVPAKEIAKQIAVQGSPCGSPATISGAAVSEVTATSAKITWKTDSDAQNCLDIDSSPYPVYPESIPDNHIRGITYAPGGYDNEYNWIDRAKVTETIQGDMQAMADARFNMILLYAAGPTGAGAVHTYDQTVFDRAAALGLKIGLRLEWYPRNPGNPGNFSWSAQDCDAILKHYEAYLAYFKLHPDLLQYFLINNPLDDSGVANPIPTIERQRNYVAYCAQRIKSIAPEALVYANSYYGWRDELPQAPFAGLVDGISLVVYAQHETGAPYGCPGVPAAADPASRLICKDQFDYYIERAWRDNRLDFLDRIILDATGFAPAASYREPKQMNGKVADSAAKAVAIHALQRYLAGNTRLSGWSYFMFLDNAEAGWGLIDRKRVVETAPATSHSIVLDNLLPGLDHSVTIRAGNNTVPLTFTTTGITEKSGPDLTITSPRSGTTQVAPNTSLTVAWQYYGHDSGATVSLYYDADDTGCNGHRIASSLPAGSGAQGVAVPLPALTGSFYIYGAIDGAQAGDCDYSPGRFVPWNILGVAIGGGPVNITVDGKLNEGIWRLSAPGTFAKHTGQPDSNTAAVQMVWDQQYLYLGFTVDDMYVERANPEAPWNDDSISAVFDNGKLRCRQDVRGTGEGENICTRAVYLLPGTTLDASDNLDPGYTVEMRIPWSELHATPQNGVTLPADFLSVDHDSAPGKAYDDPGTKFSKLSWDGDGSVETSGRSLILYPFYPVFLPSVVRATPY